VAGGESELSFMLPAAIRAGVELQPAPDGASRRQSMPSCRRCTTRSSCHRMGFRSRGAPGLGTYVVGKVVIPREYRRSAISRASQRGQCGERRFSPERLPCSPGCASHAL
jgi:hypothetical protein